MRRAHAGRGACVERLVARCSRTSPRPCLIPATARATARASSRSVPLNDDERDELVGVVRDAEVHLEGATVHVEQGGVCVACPGEEGLCAPRRFRHSQVLPGRHAGRVQCLVGCFFRGPAARCKTRESVLNPGMARSGGERGRTAARGSAPVGRGRPRGSSSRRVRPWQGFSWPACPVCGVCTASAGDPSGAGPPRPRRAWRECARLSAKRVRESLCRARPVRGSRQSGVAGWGGLARQSGCGRLTPTEGRGARTQEHC